MTTPAWADRDTDPLEWLRENESRRIAAGLRRSLVPRDADDSALDLASNDYLGLSRDARVVDAAVAATHLWGVGSTGSRLVTGTTRVHADLELTLARHVGTEAALVLSSGYLANLAIVTALAGAGDLVVSDSANHASIIDACRLSRADIVVTPTQTPAAVEAVLATRTQARAIVVTDAVFSVDGDLAPLEELAQVCATYGALLVVDEAHALGVVGDAGRGAASLHDLPGRPDVVLTATLSKALGSQGGAILGARDVIAHVIDTARPFIFDTALAPASAAAADAALDIVASDVDLPRRARSRARDLAAAARSAGWQTSEPVAAVVSLRVGDPDLAVAAAAACLARGVRVGCFRPPSVPDGVSRLRLTARADLTDADVERAREVLHDVRREVLGEASA